MNPVTFTRDAARRIVKMVRGVERGEVVTGAPRRAILPPLSRPNPDFIEMVVTNVSHDDYIVGYPVGGDPSKTVAIAKAPGFQGYMPTETKTVTSGSIFEEHGHLYSSGLIGYQLWVIRPINGTGVTDESNNPVGYQHVGGAGPSGVALNDSGGFHWIYSCAMDFPSGAETVTAMPSGPQVYRFSAGGALLSGSSLATPDPTWFGECCCYTECDKLEINFTMSNIASYTGCDSYGGVRCRNQVDFGSGFVLNATITLDFDGYESGLCRFEGTYDPSHSVTVNDLTFPTGDVCDQPVQEDADSSVHVTVYMIRNTKRITSISVIHAFTSSYTGACGIELFDSDDLPMTGTLPQAFDNSLSVGSDELGGGSVTAELVKTET